MILGGVSTCVPVGLSPLALEGAYLTSRVSTVERLSSKEIMSN